MKFVVLQKVNLYLEYLGISDYNGEKSREYKHLETNMALDRIFSCHSTVYISLFICLAVKFINSEGK